MVALLKLWVSFAKEPYKTDCVLQKRPIILKSLLIEATPAIQHVGVFEIFEATGDASLSSEGRHDLNRLRSLTHTVTYYNVCHELDSERGYASWSSR